MDSDGGDCYDDNDSSDQNEDDMDEEYLHESSHSKTDRSDNANVDEDDFPYQCLSTDEAVKLMSEGIQDVNEILNVSVCH